MTIAPGTRLGPYEILSRIGAGGMGEVWKARDPRLNRTVAIKTCHVQFSERFEREARAVAALNHPHICQIYDVGADYLVMEFIEGEPLRGPLPVARALEIAIQLADAIGAAHAKGITHRDLKPANVLLTKSGVKVLDFGLAKIERPASISENEETLTHALTQEGSIVGTLQYMAPEQLQAKENVDGRADLFSFGCVLYELLTGKRAFDGANTASIIAAIMERPAPSVAEVAPAALDRVVRRCLEKDPDRRWQTAADLKAELEWIAAGGAAQRAKGPIGASRRVLIPWIAAAVLMTVAALVGWWMLWRATRPVDHPLTRLSVDLGPNAVSGPNLTAAISPDGRRLVFPARGPDGKQQLATRLLDQAEPTLLPGTEGGSDPFFSPDGQWIGFFAAGRLSKISAQGGAPVMVSSVLAPSDFGASWGEDGTIVASIRDVVGPLSLISAAGAPRPLTKLGPDEVSHRWPQVLPGGSAVLFTASSSPDSWENANIEAISLKTGQVKIVQRGGYYGRYLPGGYLVYVHEGALFGVRFDTGKLETHGAPAPILEDVAANPVTGGGQFDFSNTGTFVYAAGKSAAQAWQVDWLDSSGKMQPLLSAPGVYTTPRLSPHGRKLAFGNGGDIYVYDPDRDTTSRLTFTGQANVPVWTPDGRHIAFRTGNTSLSWIRSDGAGEPQRLLENQVAAVPWSFSPDGRRLAYFAISPDTGVDIWTLPLDLTDPDHPRASKPEPFLRTPAHEAFPKFSPDGRWIAYRSDESGSGEIYVRPFPSGSGGKWQVSSGGGSDAFWSNNGRELFYEATDNRIMVVDYTVDGASFVPGKPRVWSDKQLFSPVTSKLDMAPDGKRFAVLALPEATPGAAGPVRVTMLFNFFDELRRKIPAK